jgi:hypothetical protein
VSLRAALLDGSIPATTVVALQDVVLADAYSAWRDTLAQHSAQFNALLDAVAALERRRSPHVNAMPPLLLPLLPCRRRRCYCASACRALNHALVRVAAALRAAVALQVDDAAAATTSRPDADAHHQQTLIAAVRRVARSRRLALAARLFQQPRLAIHARPSRRHCRHACAPPSSSVSPLAHITQPLHKTDSYDTDVSMARRKLVDTSLIAIRRRACCHSCQQLTTTATPRR